MPRIVADTVQAHRDDVHRRVYDAFADLMTAGGFETITMAGLAEGAGLKRTAIYHYFPDRESVLVGFATHTTDAYLVDLQRTLEGVDDPADRLRAYLRHQLEAGERFHIGLGPTIAGSLSDTARREMRAHIVAVEEVLRAILVEGRDRGTFTIDDLDATVSLLHACLSPRHLPPAAIESFVLRALGAGG